MQINTSPPQPHVKIKTEYYQIFLIYMCDDYETRLKQQNFAGKDIIVTIVPLDLSLYQINVIFNPPRILIHPPKLDMGIIYPENIPEHIENLKIVGETAEIIKELLRYNFPGTGF